MFRHLLTGKVRSNNGCYTCRLRRKKCDEARPVCAGCQALEITCYPGDEDKPDWMDGGPKQKEMAERIKAQVKKQASQRRDRKYLEMLENGARMVNLGPDNDNGNSTGASNAGGGRGSDAEGGRDVRMAMNGGGSGSDSEHQPRRNHHSNNTNNVNGAGVDHRLTPPASNNSPSAGGSPPEIPWHTQAFFRQASEQHQERGPDVDLHFIMIYLDYVFPYLFPHYRPPVLVGGRGWILHVVQSNRAVYHTVVSLASYFFGIVLSGGGDGGDHQECIGRMVDRLESQMELGLRELRKEMQLVTARSFPHQNVDGGVGGPAVDVREGLVLMQSIIQMLIFEVTASRKDNWKMHLDAAVALFLQILPRPEHWSDALAALFVNTFPPPTMTDGHRRPWSTNQASLRFFSAVLFHIDVMASLALGSAPRLYRYQASIIPGCQQHDASNRFHSSGPLAMEEFVGLYNFVLQMVGDVASLHSWKTVQARASPGGVLTPEQEHELQSRGRILEDAIAGTGLMFAAKLADFEARGIQHRISHVVEDALSELNGERVTESAAYVFQNWVWNQAALIHLRLVLCGWRPDDPVVREAVAAVTDRFGDLPHVSCLRGMIWPFCLVGCLAAPEDEAKFRRLADGLGALRVFGTFKEALDIMEAMWARRGQIDESWDVSQCLNVLGHGVLLI